MDIKAVLGNSQMGMRNMLWQTGYQMARNSAEICSSVVWKVKLVRNEIRY